MGVIHALSSAALVLPPPRGSGHSGGSLVGILVAILPLLGVIVAGLWFTLWSGRGNQADGEDGEGGSGPGRGPRRGPRPPRRPPDRDPQWWPEFERDFAAYVKKVSKRPRNPAPV